MLVQLQSEATENLKELSIKYGHTSGKWYVLECFQSYTAHKVIIEMVRLIFAPSEKVDAIWSTIASKRIIRSIHRGINISSASLIEGPLSLTCAYRAKVATSPLDETPNYQHVLCLYVPDVYDKDSITEVNSSVSDSQPEINVK